MKISHPIARELLEAEIDGRLTLDQGAALRSHLSECAECRDFAQSMRKLDGRLATALQARYPQTEFSAEEVDARILAVRSKLRRQTLTDRLSSAARSLAWAGALVVFAALVVLAIGTRPGQPGSILSAGRITETPAASPTPAALPTMTPGAEEAAAYPPIDTPYPPPGGAYPGPGEAYPGPDDAYPLPAEAYPLPGKESPAAGQDEPFAGFDITADLPCEPAEDGAVCQDDFLGLRFHIPFVQELKANFERGETGFKYAFGTTEPGEMWLSGGGITYDYVMGRGGMVTDFHGVPDDTPMEEICAGYSQESSYCTKVQERVFLIVSLPSADSYCNSGPGNPVNRVIVAVDFPDEYLLGGMVFVHPLIPAAKLDEFAPIFEQEDVSRLFSCEEEAMEAFDSQMTEFLAQIQSGAVSNTDAAGSIDRMQRLAESVEFLPVEEGKAESKGIGRMTYERLDSPTGNWTANLYTFFTAGRGEYYTQFNLLGGSSVVDEWRPVGLGYTTPKIVRWDEEGRYLYYTNLPHPDGCALMVNGSGLLRFDLETGENEQLAPDQGMRIALSPDAGRLAYISYGEPYLVVRDLQTGQEIRVPLPPPGLNDAEFQAGAIVWSPDGSSLALTLAMDPCGRTVPWSESVIVRVNAETLEMDVLLQTEAEALRTAAWPEPGTIRLEDAESNPYYLDAQTGALSRRE